MARDALIYCGVWGEVSGAEVSGYGWSGRSIAHIASDPKEDGVRCRGTRFRGSR
jgi:hypothetical protein